MAKLKNPLLSLKAYGSLGKALSFCRRRGLNLVEKRPVVPDQKTPAQLAHRNMFGLCVDLWHTLSAAEKAVWESAGTARHMTGYAWYISQCLRPNPGIYLPLAGGTMSGDILLASNRLRNLPAPAAANDAARKTYVDGLRSGSGRVIILGPDYVSIGQGSWLASASASRILGFIWLTSTLANGDNISYSVYLQAGTYTFLTVHQRDSNGAQVNVELDGIQQQALQMYAGGLTHNVIVRSTGKVVAATGLKTIRVRVTGKHASSSNYGCFFNYIALWRTA